MPLIMEYFSAPTWAHLTAALAHTLWQAALAAAVLVVVLKATPAGRTDLRYGACVAALLAVVMGGFLTWAVLEYEPRGKAGSMGEMAGADRSSSNFQRSTLNAKRETTEETESKAGPLRRAQDRRLGGRTMEDKESKAGRFAGRTMEEGKSGGGSAAASSGVGKNSQNQSGDSAESLSRWTAWLAAAWVAGVATMLVRAALLLLGAGRLRRRCRALKNEAVDALVEQLRDTLRLARRVGVSVSDHIVAPAVLGVFWPTILLPASMLAGIRPDHLRAALAHELAHIRRYGYLVNLAQLLIEALLFFNPAVWWISHQIRVEREACCDALAARATGDNIQYARTLAEVAAALRPSLRGLEVAQAFGGPRLSGGLLDRVRRLATPAHRPNLRLPWYSLAAVLLAGGLILAGLRQGADATIAAAAKWILSKEQLNQIEDIDRRYKLEDKYVSGKDEYTVSVSGIVRTTTGSLPARRNLTLLISSRRSNWSSSMAISPRKDGRFTAKAPSGSIHVAAWAKGYASTVVGPYMGEAGSSLDNIELILDPGFTAMIRFVDSADHPIVGARVKGYRCSLGPTSWEPFELASDSTGAVTLDHWSQRPTNLKAWADGYQYDEKKDIQLKPGETLTWPLQAAKPAKGVVRSRDTGEPIPEARILLVHSTVPPYPSSDAASNDATTTADAAGRFQLSSLRDGAVYTAVAWAPGLERKIVRDIRAGQESIQIDLGTGLFIKGTITGPLDELSDYEKGKAVSYRNPYKIGDTSYESSYWETVNIRDGVGYFVISHLFAGRVDIQAGKVSRRLDVQAPIDDLVIDLAKRGEEPSVTTRPVVFRLDVPADAHPATGTLRVSWLVIKHGDRYMEPHDLPIINNEARAEVPTPGEVGYEAKGLVGYWIDHVWSIKIPAGDRELVITIPVVPAGAIYGKVFESDGSLAKGVMMSLLIVKNSPLLAGTVPGVLGQRRPDTDLKNGTSPDDTFNRFSASPLPLEGTYAIAARNDARVALSPPIRLTDQNPIREVAVRFAKGITVSGTVARPDGSPMPVCSISLQYNTPYHHSFGHEQETDREGRFSFEGVDPKAPGGYTLQVRSHTLYQSAYVKIRPSEKPVEIRLENGYALQGKVAEGKTGWPVPNATVTASAANYSGIHEGEITWWEAEVPTNDKGEFRFSNLGTREVRFHVQNVRRSPNVTATPGQSAPVVLEVELHDNGDLRARKP